MFSASGAHWWCVKRACVRVICAKVQRQNGVLVDFSPVDLEDR